jgi:hypothetical protein
MTEQETIMTKANYDVGVGVDGYSKVERRKKKEHFKFLSMNICCC